MGIGGNSLKRAFFPLIEFENLQLRGFPFVKMRKKGEGGGGGGIGGILSIRGRFRPNLGVFRERCNFLKTIHCSGL